MNVLLILPVIALVLFSFAKPEFRYTYAEENNYGSSVLSSLISKEVKGTVIHPDGKPLEGAAIVVKGTTTGTITGTDGKFSLSVPSCCSLSYT